MKHEFCKLFNCFVKVVIRYKITHQKIKSFTSYKNIKGGMKENLNGSCPISYFKLPCSRRLFSHTEHLIM